MFIGIDLGTTSVKTILIDEEGTTWGTVSEPVAVSRPRPGWSEQDPEHWWAAVAKTLDGLKAAHPAAMAAVRGIGLSGHMHGATLLDAQDRVLRPAILWNDGRSADECLDIEASFPEARAVTGNIAMPGFTAPKLAWVRRHEPEIFAQVAKVLLPKDFVRLRLIGDYVSDMSDSAGTYWLDVGRRDWSDALLAATGLDRSHMPRLAEGTEATGRLKPDLAARWGMTTAPVVAGGAGDNAASACGIGAVTPGSAFLSLGTSGVLFVSNARFSPNTAGAVHAFCHALPQTWHQMGVILSATDSLNWLARILDAPAPTLAGALGASVAAPSDVMFLPYLSGERTPWNDAAARGVFVGLSQSTERTALTQAVLEGVGFAFRDCLRVLEEAGTAVTRAFAVGGGSNSPLWLKIMASILNRPLDLGADADVGAALGAARLAMAAALGGDPVRFMPPPAIKATIEPDPALVPAYAEAYERYRALYPLARAAVPAR
ncbi:xylulokinase [Lichenifustis flavocetrariae]|uniref:Xylulose kinase n=1 Tax=Lichenifustis flavocetrariae TaxID=2949735 RepID=A0AA41Z7L7_9HYPH|nr:xylulokinase [Lichenifustis flavocetrariae]MCW6511963.1 xylulokinase [Lichenifustis flavocetrariae]